MDICSKFFFGGEGGPEGISEIFGESQLKMVSPGLI
jgi:hypothetical protein